MDNLHNREARTFHEVNLKVFFRKIWERKFLFLASTAACLALAVLYVKMATPIYEAHASLLIDPSGKSRMLGESKYVDGTVGLIGTEKNLFNEIGILKSFSLIDRALDELDFEVSYHAGPWYKLREYYGYFPFEVMLVDSSAQLYGAPFQVELLSDTEYRLTVEADRFQVSNPANGTKHLVEQAFNFSNTYQFGQEVSHDYFHFILKKPSYKVSPTEFEDKGLSFQLHSRDKLINAFKEKLKVEQLDIQADILQVRIRGPVLDKELAFLGKLTDNFISSKLMERDEIASTKETFIRNQLASISDSLNLAEKRLEGFRKGANVVNLSLSASNSLDQLKILESEQAQLELNIKYYTSLLGYLKPNVGIEKIIAPSVVGIDDPLLNENLLEIRRLHGEKARLSFYKGEKSYDLNVLDQQITATTNSLRENIKNLLESSRVALQDKNSRIATLEGKINQLPTDEKQLLDFERKSNLYDNLYKYLSQELAKAGIAKAETMADTKVLDAPRMVGNGPVSPQKMMIMALALIVGLVIPVVWMVFADSFGETIGNSGQIEALTAIPIAAKIFRNKSPKCDSLDLEGHAPVEEPFRDLAANLQFFVTEPDQNIIGVSSSLASEGKSFCAAHLALSLAAAGKLVLLMDLNFRNPSLIKNFQTGNIKELSSYLLTDSVSADEIIYPHPELPSLFYIPTYEEGEQPHRLLSSPKLKTLINALKYGYDYVIIDSAAMGLVSDYLLVARNIDIHLFVLRQGMAKISFLNDLEQLQEKGDIKNLFLVFNEAAKRPSKAKYEPRRNSVSQKRIQAQSDNKVLAMRKDLNIRSLSKKIGS